MDTAETVRMKTCSEVMTSALICCLETDSVQAAAMQMKRADVGSIPGGKAGSSIAARNAAASRVTASTAKEALSGPTSVLSAVLSPLTSLLARSSSRRKK